MYIAEIEREGRFYERKTEREREEGDRSSSYTRYQTRVFRYGQQPLYLALAFIPLYNNAVGNGDGTVRCRSADITGEDSEVSPSRRATMAIGHRRFLLGGAENPRTVPLGSLGKLTTARDWRHDDDEDDRQLL